VVTVGDMAGAACVEWHLHAWDLARALGKDYCPASPTSWPRGWRRGLPHLPLGRPAAMAACGGRTSRGERRGRGRRLAVRERCVAACCWRASGRLA
jgi:hypothetical protein